MNRLTERTAQSECPACGAAGEGIESHVCSICGKFLAEGYQPLDKIRSSYGLQRMALATGSHTNEKMQLFATEPKNTASQYAWASFVYSLVPYLGVLFIPFTVMASIAGLAKAWRDPTAGGRDIALRSFGLSAPVLAVQIVLWWLLYYIPELAR